MKDIKSHANKKKPYKGYENNKTTESFEAYKDIRNKVNDRILVITIEFWTRRRKRSTTYMEFKSRRKTPVNEQVTKKSGPKISAAFTCLHC